MKPLELLTFMRESGLDQFEAATYLGLSVRQYRRYISGHSTIPSTVARLAYLLRYHPSTRAALDRYPTPPEPQSHSEHS